VRANGKVNSQLAFYGIGAVETLRRLVEQFNVKEIELVVVQPRRGGVQRVTTTHAALLELSDELVEAKANALSDNPRSRPAIGASSAPAPRSARPFASSPSSERNSTSTTACPYRSRKLRT
jgi:hypothetical protein